MVRLPAGVFLFPAGVFLSCVSRPTPAHPTPRVSSQPSIKQRLAQLQLSPGFTFTAGLAAEVAARSLSFTTMQEQTFGDEEEEHIIQENENEVEEK